MKFSAHLEERELTEPFRVQTNALLCQNDDLSFWEKGVNPTSTPVCLVSFVLDLQKQVRISGNP